MRRPLLLILLFGIALSLCFSAANADDSFLDISEKYITEFSDMSDKMSFSPSVSNSSDDTYEILFDFREHNEQIIAIQGDKARAFVIYKDPQEQLSVLFHMITKFKDIESAVPDGMSLAYRVWLSEAKEFYITLDTIDKYYLWL